MFWWLILDLADAILDVRFKWAVLRLHCSSVFHILDVLIVYFSAWLFVKTNGCPLYRWLLFFLAWLWPRNQWPSYHSWCGRVERTYVWQERRFVSTSTRQTTETMSQHTAQVSSRAPAAKSFSSPSLEVFYRLLMQSGSVIISVVSVCLLLCLYVCLCALPWITYPRNFIFCMPIHLHNS